MTLTPLIIRLTISTGVYIPLVIIGFACHPDTSNQPDDPSGWWTPEEKQWIISELNRTTRELEKEINDLTDPQWNFREEPGRWSIAEIVEHHISEKPKTKAWGVSVREFGCLQ